MSRRVLPVLALILILAFVEISFAQTKAETVITNISEIIGVGSGFGFNISETNYDFTVGRIYGISRIAGIPASYTARPLYQYRQAFRLTNLGNDADDLTEVSITSFSNNVGYNEADWIYSLEFMGVNVGTNFTIPPQYFGEGAIARIILVVDIPRCDVESVGFITVSASTPSNDTRLVAIYDGFNGVQYGGHSYDEAELRIDLVMPNSIATVLATDDIDTINVFDGSRGLRRSQNKVLLQLGKAPDNISSVKLWVAKDTLAQGGGENEGSYTMAPITSDSFIGKIPSEYLKDVNFVSFLFEVDQLYYAGNYTYRLFDLHKQDNYQTVIMKNVIDDEKGYIQIPAEAVGEEGRIEVYSIAGDRVRTILSGKADSQIYSWDGKDDNQVRVHTGTYFMIIAFPELREVRKFYVR
jgi:hypothetical protein